MKKLMMAVVVAAAWAAHPGSARADLAIVASASSQASALDADKAAQVMLGKSSAFADGRKTHLVDLPESAPERAKFYSEVTGKTDQQVKAYWARQSFAGKGVPPKELGSQEAVKSALKEDPDAVGYVDAKQVDASLKILFNVKE